MEKYERRSVMVLTTLGCILVGGGPVGAEWYSTDIEYRQAVTRILTQSDINWSNKPDDYYNFSSLVLSGNGEKVFLKGNCYYCDESESRPFLVNSDGTSLQDLSGMLPADIVGKWSSWRNMKITDDGTRLFFRAVIEAGYYDDEYLYAYDVASQTTELAVNRKFSTRGSSWHFRTNNSGTRVYLDDYGISGDDGLYYADTGGTVQWFFDIDDLPCNSYCGSLNMFDLMGVATGTDRAFFQWNSDYSQTDGSNEHDGFYYTGLDGVPHLIGGEHYWIAEEDIRGICSSDGTKAIYTYRESYGDPKKVALVDVDTATETVIGGSSGLNPINAHLSRSGNIALLNGEYGDYGTYYKTMFDTVKGTSRDTWSYFFFNRWDVTSNLSNDDRYYFHSADGSPEAGLYRIDTKTTGDAEAPYVTSISFSAPVILDYDDVEVTVRAQISDPQGVGTIEWVKLTPLVEGQEEPEWYMAREPLAFPSADSGSTLLYDDGTNGDEVAGDGIFTFDSVATRKTGRDGEEAFNTWYSHYPLPALVGIRIAVMDSDNNYGIGDTAITIAKLFVEQDVVVLEKGQSTDLKIFGAQQSYTATIDKSEVADVSVTDDTLRVTAKSGGTAEITVNDGTGNSFTIQLTVQRSGISPGVISLMLNAD